MSHLLLEQRWLSRCWLLPSQMYLLGQALASPPAQTLLRCAELNGHWLVARIFILLIYLTI